MKVDLFADLAGRSPSITKSQVLRHGWVYLLSSGDLEAEKLGCQKGLRVSNQRNLPGRYTFGTSRAKQRTVNATLATLPQLLGLGNLKIG